MTIQKKVNRIFQVLDELYPEPGIPLKHKDPYSLLVATVLSAQCTDVRVNQVAEVLFQTADNPRA